MKDVLDIIKESCILQNRTDSYYANDDNGRYCEQMFDGLMCWPQTLAGSLANQSCSNELMKSTKQGFATRKCENDGNWFIPENSNATWANYTDCGTFYVETFYEQTVPTVYLKWLPIIKTITHFGYVLSIISLVLALIVFINIKRLHCSRNKLHMNLFLSFVMRATMSLLKDGLFVQGTTLIHETTFIDGEPSFTKDNYSWICKAVISLWQYFIMSNYMFLLMEGTYLHNLMFFNLFAEGSVLIYCISGWVLPIIFIIPWIILKALKEDFLCWTKNKYQYISLLIDIPIALSVIINFILFTIIVRVLFVKLTSMYIQQRRTKYRKLLRSTLILVPLFGIPYIISVILFIYVTNNELLEILWILFDQTFTSFQGFLASFTYCLLNNEVQTELKRKYYAFNDRNKRKSTKRSRTISTTQQIMIPLNDELPEIIQNLGQHDDVNKKTSEFF